MRDENETVSSRDAVDSEGESSGPRQILTPREPASAEPASAVQGAGSDEDIGSAERLIAGGTLPSKVSRELERRLAKRGRRDLAVQVRARRQALDRARALDILGGARAEPSEMLELGKSLADYKDTGYARRLLDLASSTVTKDSYPDLYTEIFQKAALYTYKDQDLPLAWKLDRAYTILGKTESLADTCNPETLGLLGAIFKRRWEADGKRQHLERALFHYLKGFAQGLPAEARADVLAYLRANPGCSQSAGTSFGYNGINAAFVLDLLAAQEAREARRAGVVASVANERRQQARLIRTEIALSVPALLTRLPSLSEQWWYYATVGEATFGLGRYAEALEWLIERPKAAGLRVALDRTSPAGLEVPEWEYESTARQLAQLARAQWEAAASEQGQSPTLGETEFETSDAARALGKFLGGDLKALRSAFRGKFGLGLSGGGFRASLFHIGVLARLAEIDALRHVEVLSCVSGGSIVGAYYYLEVRRLLETKSDDDITRQDYIDIVRRLERHFLEGVQRNIRTRVLAELSTNLKMIFSPRYSRTLRVGELYERELYSRIQDDEDGTSPVSGPRWVPDPVARMLGFKRRPRLLKDLFIRPMLGAGPDGQPQRQLDFSPRRHNWRRKHKAPILVLNATALNTGHNWQFTASYMGEPPLPIHAGIDCNYRLRRLYYKDAPPGYPDVRLGHAVAASACVPGLFEPLTLDALYPDSGERRISVRLVDGGVCDNQGIASLLEQDCSVMLVSDGSGQMEAEDMPSAGVLGVPLRSNSILQARVREAQYGDIASRRSSDVLRGLMFVHLKQELAGEGLAWRGCPPDQKQSEFEQATSSTRAGETGITSYGVACDTQRKLAAVRTDLDSFSDAEAYALMASGYRMAANQFRGREPCVEGFEDVEAESWTFRALEPAMAPRGQHKERLDALLDAAKSSAFKVWKLSAALVALKWLLIAATASALLWLFSQRWNEPLVPQSVYAWTAAHLTFRSAGLAALAFGAFALLAAAINAVIGRAYGKHIMRALRWRDTLQDIAVGVTMSLLGWLVARVHLHVFDRIYLRYGKLDRFIDAGRR